MQYMAHCKALLKVFVWLFGWFGKCIFLCTKANTTFVHLCESLGLGVKRNEGDKMSQG